jgi:hypothetical protein
MARPRDDMFFMNYEDTGFQPTIEDIIAQISAPIEQPSIVQPTIVQPTRVQPTTPTQSAQSDKNAVIDKLASQIKAQGTTDKWTGGYGADAATKDMARILADTGITDISQFGPVTKEVELYMGEGVDGTPIYQKQTEQTFGNKLTGQPVANTYSERQTGNAFGGTFEGKGNTGYRVDFTPEGTPIFYTTGASSNDLFNLLQDNKLLNIAANVAAATFGGPVGSAALQLAQGKDIKDAAKAAALTYAGQQITSGLGDAPSLAPSTDASSLINLGASQGMTAAELAQLDMALGGVGGSAGATELANALATGAPTITNTALTGGSGVFTNPASDVLPTNVTEPVVPVEAVIPEVVVTSPAATPVQTPIDLGIDYSLANTTAMPPLTDMGGAQGVQAGTAANLPEMGGAQGITFNVGAPVTTVADAVNAIATMNGSVTPDNLSSMGGAQGLTYQTPSGLVTEGGTLNVGGLTGNNSVISQGGIDTASNIGSDIAKRVADIDTSVDKIKLPSDKTYTTAEIIDMIRLGVLGASVLGAATDDGPTGFPIVPIPADWKSPIYGSGSTSVASKQLPPIDFGSRELLRGTQWEKFLDPNYGQVPAPVQFNQPANMSYDRLMSILGTGKDVLPSQALTINDVISGIQNQYGQTTNSAMGQKPT